MVTFPGLWSSGKVRPPGQRWWLSLYMTNRPSPVEVMLTFRGFGLVVTIPDLGSGGPGFNSRKPPLFFSRPMRVVALVSGGKDSCYCMLECVRLGHEVVALANLHPAEAEAEEVDSYMYQTVGHGVVAALAECMGLPLFRRAIHGEAVDQGLTYSAREGDEVEDLRVLLAEVQVHAAGSAAPSAPRPHASSRRPCLASKPLRPVRSFLPISERAWRTCASCSRANPVRRHLTFALRP